MSNPISQLASARDKLIEGGSMLREAQADVVNLQVALNLDSLLLDLTLPEEATTEMRAAVRRLMAAARQISQKASMVHSKVFATRHTMCEALILVMQAAEMCGPLDALQDERMYLADGSQDQDKS